MAVTALRTFSVRNVDRGTMLVRRGALASNFMSRFLGLMGRRGVEDGGGLLITRSSSIHSCFMRFRFDAVFIDAGGRVVKVVPSMRTWRLAFGGKGAKDVLELPSGVAAATQTVPGDLLAFEPAA
jgi:uncharacterized membrane protein (UPF0127 family)